MPETTTLEQQVRERMRVITSEQLGVDKDKITNETHLYDDLGADSLDRVELVMEFEEEYNITILDHEAERLNTFDDYVRKVLEELS